MPYSVLMPVFAESILAAGPQGLGPVMKTLAPMTAGKADGGRVSAEVRRQLTS